MVSNENLEREFMKQNDKFKETLLNVLGDAVRKPVSARLGYVDDLGNVYIQVPSSRTDQPNKYYFHEAGASEFQGEAFLAQGVLQDWMLVYGMPIRLRKDPLNHEWEIIGADTRLSSQFLSEAPQTSPVLIPYKQIQPGLLTETTPESMSARVLGGMYRIGSSQKYIKNKNTIDWSEAPQSSNVPATINTQRFVLVQMNFDTGLLEYKYGDEISATINFIQAYDLNVDLGDNSILPVPDERCFRCGYVRLISGMTAILAKNHIIPLQDYLGTPIDVASSASNFDETVIPFDYTSVLPITITDVVANDHISSARIVIDVAFNGTVSLKVGTAGVTDSLMTISENDPYTVGGYESTPDIDYGGAETVKLYGSISGASQGEGRVILTRSKQ